MEPRQSSNYVEGGVNDLVEKVALLMSRWQQKVEVEALSTK
jgi:hypothetical protein